jgi:hypothetical protein
MQRRAAHLRRGGADSGARGTHDRFGQRSVSGSMHPGCGQRPRAVSAAEQTRKGPKGAGMDSRNKSNAIATGKGCLPEEEALGRADSHRLGHTPTCTQLPPEHLRSVSAARLARLTPLHASHAFGFLLAAYRADVRSLGGGGGGGVSLGCPSARAIAVAESHSSSNMRVVDGESCPSSTPPAKPGTT